MSEDCFHLGIKALIKKDGLYLLLRVNPATLVRYSGEPYYDLPGGRIHVGETVEEVLRREVEEETGITDIQSFAPLNMVLSPLRIPVNGGDVGLILSVYVCEIGEVGDIHISDEHLDFGWFSANQAAELLSYKFPREFVDMLRKL